MNEPMKVTNEESSNRYEKLYAMLLDAIPCSILFINRDMRILSANQNFLQKSKRTRADTVGYRLEAVFPTILLDHMDITRRIRKVFEENRPTRGERLTYRAPGLAMRIYYYIILPFSWDGVVESAMLLMEDVTEQVRLSEDVNRLERHLASIVECASDIILSTNTKGEILTWNTAAESIFGHTFEDVRGRSLFDFCAKDHHKEVEEVFENIMVQQNSIMVEWDIVTKDDNLIPVYWVFSPLRARSSEAVGIVAVGRDLTARRKLEMQLLQSQKLAALGVMAGGIAHEIRNPLAICSSAAQFLMEDEIATQFRKECAQKIHSGIQRASTIIENLLRFARPSARTDIGPVDLCLLISETLALVANQAKIQKIAVTCDLPCTSVVISGISSLLQQVFINLFLNAINAMRDGGQMSISMTTSGSAVLIRISDTGTGIGKSDLDKIFDPFYTTSPVGKGTGLGLSICYSIVQHHFGSIEVESFEGKGSTFTVRLPIL